jgi:hypothetical protein
MTRKSAYQLRAWPGGDGFAAAWATAAASPKERKCAARDPSLPSADCTANGIPASIEGGSSAGPIARPARVSWVS